MSSAVAEQIMARKRTGRPPVGRNDVTVKLDNEVANRAKVVAADRSDAG